MATPKRTNKAPAPSMHEVVNDAVRRALAEAKQPNLGYGDGSHGSKAGERNAKWIDVRLTGPGAYDVVHELGSVPVLCELKQVESAVGATPVPQANASPVRRQDWTATTARVDIVAVGAGSLDNCIAKFLVKGA